MTFASRLAAVTLAALMGWTVPGLRRSRRRRRNCRRRNGARPQHLSAGRIGHLRPQILRQRLARARLGHRARGEPVGPAQRLHPGRGRLRRLRRRPALRRGTLYTKNAGDLRVYWQGPSLGFDWGGDGARTMTLVYNLPATNAIYQRFAASTAPPISSAGSA